MAGREPAAPCLPTREGKTLTALFGVAYTEISGISALLNVPKLSRIFRATLSSASLANHKREQTRRSQAHIWNLGSSEPFWSNRRIARKPEFPPRARLSRNPAAVRVYDDLRRSRLELPAHIFSQLSDDHEFLRFLYDNRRVIFVVLLTLPRSEAQADKSKHG